MDAPFVVSRCYVLVSATNGDVLVLEGDTGRLAQTRVMPKTAGPGMGIGTYLVEDGDAVRALDGAQRVTIGTR